MDLGKACPRISELLGLLSCTFLLGGLLGLTDPERTRTVMIYLPHRKPNCATRLLPFAYSNGLICYPILCGLEPCTHSMDSFEHA